MTAPPGLARRPMPRRPVLRDQLRVLDSKLDEIADYLQRENADRLLANERFSEEHFGRPPQADPDLRLP